MIVVKFYFCFIIGKDLVIYFKWLNKIWELGVKL